MAERQLLASERAIEGMKKIQPNPRKFRRLRVHCRNHHELCSVYATPNGPVVTGRATIHNPAAATSNGPGWSLNLNETELQDGTVCLTLPEYRRLMRVTHDPAEVDPEAFAEWLGEDSYDTDPFQVGSENYKKIAVNQQHGVTFPSDWRLHFRCRCSQAMIGPAWIESNMPDTRRGARDVTGPAGMD